jgi:hypothetical protein
VALGSIVFWEYYYRHTALLLVSSALGVPENCLPGNSIRWSCPVLLMINTQFGEKTMRTRVLLCCMLLLAVLLAGCKKPEDKLLGTWKIVSGGEEVYFTFQKNNELNVNNAIFTKYFVTKDNELVLGVQEPVPFSVKNGVLRIKQEGLILTYQKVK